MPPSMRRSFYRLSSLYGKGTGATMRCVHCGKETDHTHYRNKSYCGPWCADAAEDFFSAGDMRRQDAKDHGVKANGHCGNCTCEDC